MTFAKDTIKLGAARTVFTGIELVEIVIGSRTVGYRAILPCGVSYEHTSLTTLCQQLWESVFQAK